MKIYFRAALLCIIPFLLLATLVSAAEKEQAEPKAAPQQSVAGEDYDQQSSFAALPIPENALRFPDPFIAEIAHKVQNGTADLRERRLWYMISLNYAPFTAGPPKNWRLKALADGRKLLPGVNGLNAPQATYAWSNLGPFNYNIGGSDLAQGRSTVVWVHPTNPNFIFAGFADGGLWKTLDSGATWMPLTDFEVTTAIGSLDVLIGSDTVNLSDAILYAATGEGNTSSDSVDGGGVLKSTDGGATWALQTIPWANPDAQTSARWRHSIRRIRIDLNVANAQSVWAAGDGGVYHTTDGGSNWALVTGLPYTGKPGVGGCWPELATDFVIDDSVNPSLLYVAFGARSNASTFAPLSCTGVADDPNYRKNNGIYRSVDGTSWLQISRTAGGFPAIPGNVGRITLMQAPSDKKQVYALISCVNNGASTCPNGQYSSLGIFRTSDATLGSVSWAMGTTTNFCAGQGWYDLAGAVDPTNPAKLLVAGLDTYLSTNNGSSISKVSSWTGSGTGLVHADQHYILYYNASTVFISCDGGLYKGTVSGSTVSWSNLNGGGLSTLQFYGMAGDPVNPAKMHGGLQDNGEAYTGNGTTWFETFGGDGGFSATDQSNGNNAYEEYVYAAIARSLSGGSGGWSCIQNLGGCSGCGGCVPDNQTAFIAPMELDANNQKILYTGSKFVYKNVNAPASATWAKISPDLVGTTYDYILHIHSAPNHGVSGVIWVTTLNGKIWVTTNSGTTWTDTSHPPLPRNSILPNRAASWITTHPQHGNQAIAVFSGWNGSGDQPGHVFRTNDGGVSWEDITGVLPDEPVFAVAVDPARPNDVYIGTEFGVYVNNNGWTANSWTKINNTQLPNVHIHELQFSKANGRLRAATHGRGIWELSQTCPAFDPPVLNNASLNTCSVDLGWAAGASTGATYNVYRSAGGCPGSSYTLLSSGIAPTNYTDASASSGQTYSYVISTAEGANSCESSFSNCMQVTLPGTCPCIVPPNFGGVTTVTAGTDSGCALIPAWTAATQNCGTDTPLYNIYRATTPNFVPDPSNRIATCVAGNNYYDGSGLSSNTTYYYVVRAEDNSGAGSGACRGGNEDANQGKRSATTALSCTTCPTLTLSPSTVPDGQVGTPYSQTFVVSGGTGPYTYTKNSGTFPAGMTLNSSTGNLSGTPTAPGTFNFSIKAVDINGCATIQSYSFTVSCAVIGLTPATLPDGATQQLYSQTIVASGGTAPYTFTVSAGALPTGTSLNASTGEISGTPTVVQTANFSITATDAHGCAGVVAYTVNVVQGCLFCDDFENGVLDLNWTYSKQTAWMESGGSLTGTGGKKTTAIASPVFAGCLNCYVESSVQMTKGIVWMYGWYVDKKNTMELQLKEKGNKILLKERVSNHIVAKASASFILDPNVAYVVRVTYDGTLFHVSVNGTELFTLTPKRVVPSGTAGFGVKQAVGSFGYISVF